MSIKEKLLEVHYEMLDGKIDVFQDMIRTMTEDAQNDAKSSAGDKHETTLSKMHIEQENLSNKIREAISAKEILKRIDPKKKSEVVGFGSLIRINAIYLFVSTALPKVFIDDYSVLAISEDAPLIKMLWGKKIFDEVTYNGSVFRINELE
ncbi:hypothetical protein [Myroides guanonis]|uniref:Uncharacterized protein n=1 Tax=Myroides guanonis TaxID=1150112 RepID=A0A1I3QNL0_9FLAO|nr:hypothetical protein [Myroides guanonis]SFJ35688.1 hypothetical protein SAMN04487893_10662 [Myroides guanonis]